MNPVQKISKNDALFPFSFVYQDRKSPQKELPDHIHDYYEIVYVYGGKGHFFINDTFYEMGQGDVFLIPINTIHRALPDSIDPVTSSVIFFGPTLIYNVFLDDSFSYLSLFELIKRQNNYKMSLQTKVSHTMEAFLSSIYQEMIKKEVGSRHAALLFIHQILLDLYRLHIHEKQEKMETARFGPSWLKEILAYIDNNLSQPLSLADLAQEALVSPEHFSRVFKQSTGMGLTVYLNTKKMIKAKELLLETDHKISEIAEMCGFESMTHFHRIFKKFVDATPSNYRKQRSTSFR